MTQSPSRRPAPCRPLDAPAGPTPPPGPRPPGARRGVLTGFAVSVAAALLLRALRYEPGLAAAAVGLAVGRATAGPVTTRAARAARGTGAVRHAPAVRGTVRRAPLWTAAALALLSVAAGQFLGAVLIGAAETDLAVVSVVTGHLGQVAEVWWADTDVLAVALPLLAAATAYATARRAP